MPFSHNIYVSWYRRLTHPARRNGSARQAPAARTPCPITDGGGRCPPDESANLVSTSPVTKRRRRKFLSIGPGTADAGGGFRRCTSYTRKTDPFYGRQSLPRPAPPALTILPPAAGGVAAKSVVAALFGLISKTSVSQGAIPLENPSEAPGCPLQYPSRNQSPRT